LKNVWNTALVTVAFVLIALIVGIMFTILITMGLMVWGQIDGG
jgi:hypothetical protein